jgi:hypothetical protein
MLVVMFLQFHPLYRTNEPVFHAGQAYLLLCIGAEGYNAPSKQKNEKMLYLDLGDTENARFLGQLFQPQASIHPWQGGLAKVWVVISEKYEPSRVVMSPSFSILDNMPEDI